MYYKNSLSDSFYEQELEHEYEYKRERERVREHETYKVREQEHS